MKDYKKLNLPLLTTKDEEYHLLYDIADVYLKQKAKTERKKSGDATEVIVRDYLIKHCLNMALDKELTSKELTIKGYQAHTEADRIDALLLKAGINQHKLIYEPEEVDTVIEIKKTAASDTVSNDIHRKFKALQAISSGLRFAVIILSERLLSPTPYKNAICEEKVDIAKCKVFTCVLRRIYLGLHHKDVLVNAQKEGQLWKSGEWQDLINYLKTK
jgi:hypothetical protein